MQVEERRRHLPRVQVPGDAAPPRTDPRHNSGRDQFPQGHCVEKDHSTSSAVRTASSRSRVARAVRSRSAPSLPAPAARTRPARTPSRLPHLPLEHLIEPVDVSLPGLFDAMERLAAGELAGKVMVTPGGET